MKYAVVCILSGAFLIALPMLVLAYQSHEVAVAMQSFAVNHYMGSFNIPPIGLAWRLIPWVSGSVLVVCGVILGALKIKQPSAPTVGGVGLGV